MTDTTSATPSGRRKAKNKEPVNPVLALEDLVLCARRVANGLNEALSKNKVSFEEWSVLKGLIGRENVPVREVARNAGLGQPQFRKMLGALQQRGLILSKTPPGGDKKQTTISATPRATALRPIVSSELQQLLGEGAEKSGQVFDRAVARLNRVERSLRQKAKGAKAASAQDEAEDDD